jgi:hypothetical protein
MIPAQCRQLQHHDFIVLSCAAASTHNKWVLNVHDLKEVDD